MTGNGQEGRKRWMREGRGLSSIWPFKIPSPRAEIAEHFNVGQKSSNQLSDRSVRAILLHKRLKSLRRPQKWLISQKNRQLRLDFAKIFKKHESSFWRGVVFSDECLFECTVGLKRIRARTSDEALRKFLMETTRQEVCSRFHGRGNNTSFPGRKCHWS